MDNKGDYLSHLKFLVDSHLVIIDDLGSSGINDWRKEVIFELIDYRYESELPTVFTSNLTESEVLQQYGSRIHSRLFSTENTFIESNDEDQRLKKKDA